MLHEGCVSKRLLTLLRILQKEPVLKDYFLVRGTALAMQIGHRISIAIDLFTQNELNIPEISVYLAKTYRNKYQIINSQKMIYQVVIDGIKVDFVHHPFELVEPVYHESHIAYLGKNDIAAMKLHAIETSGNRAKDFADIFFLLKEIPLEDMFAYYQKKYSTNNIFNAKRSLGYFEDVPDESWKEVRLIDESITQTMIKETIIKAISNFNGKNLSP